MARWRWEDTCDRAEQHYTYSNSTCNTILYNTCDRAQQHYTYYTCYTTIHIQHSTLQHMRLGLTLHRREALCSTPPRLCSAQQVSIWQVYNPRCSMASLYWCVLHCSVWCVLCVGIVVFGVWCVWHCSVWCVWHCRVWCLVCVGIVVFGVTESL